MNITDFYRLRTGAAQRKLFHEQNMEQMKSLKKLLWTPRKTSTFATKESISHFLECHHFTNITERVEKNIKKH